MTILHCWLVALLLSCQPTPDTTMQKENAAALIKAVTENNISVVKTALEKGQSVNTTDREGSSLLLLATRGKLVDMATLLVSYKANVNQQNQQQDSPFLLAGANGSTNLVRLFLQHGARFDVFNRYHGTALIPACERGHIETVQLLVNTPGFPIDHVNRLGWTALLEAVILGNGSDTYVEIVKLLLDAGANRQIPDKEGRTAFEHAKKSGYVQIAALLSDR